MGDTAGRYKRRFGGSSGINRRATQMSRGAWGSFFQKGKGWDVMGRFDSARGAVAQKQMMGGKAIGARSAIRAAGATAGKAGIGRTLAALARPVVGVGAAYFTWGMLIPMAAEGAISGFNALAREGEKWRRGTPETSVGRREMATRDRAMTMRQASTTAIHSSQMGVRAALGNEASFLHG